MLSSIDSDPSDSHVWLTPDFGLGFHQFDYMQGEYDGLAHTHGEYTFVMCLAGSVDIIYEQRHEIVNAGEILIVNPGELHRCRFGVNEPKSKGFTLIVRPPVLYSVAEAMALPYSGISRKLRFLGRFQNPEAFALIYTLLEEYRQRRRGYDAMVEMIVRQILIHVLRSWPSEAVVPFELNQATQLPWLHMHRATEFMNAHGKGGFRLSELCNAVGLSSSRFIPLFKNSAGISPHTYYNSLIISKACRMLQVEQLSTKEVAYSLGFRNVSHFCTLFHQVTGATPKKNQKAFDGTLSLS